ncbi:hypothetical protein [Cohnella terricola]|uniref:Uncharacterized protein n=1 Tax=Cohnella terricola TaxID=1289167 RepID=A0A559JSY1_9BACL|nr:hypothetical protein [Cohnella terricola]TVY02986.1 hypothetical protein FPZ45_03605 [Cohnella terricola]
MIYIARATNKTVSPVSPFIYSPLQQGTYRQPQRTWVKNDPRSYERSSIEVTGEGVSAAQAEETYERVRKLIGTYHGNPRMQLPAKGLLLNVFI